MNVVEFCLFIAILLISLEASSQSPKKGKKSKGHTDSRVIDVKEPYSGQRIRFGVNKNLNGYSNGLLEVYRGGKWGIVCDDDWDEQDADVACRELGFALGSKRPIYQSPPEQDKWDILSFIVNNVECQGNEGSLLSCSYSTNTECDISEAVSVTCIIHDKAECGESKTGEWIAGDDSCYMIKPFSKDLRYNKVLRECAGEQENSHLAIIETEAEHNFVSTLLSRHDTDISRVFVSSKLGKGNGSVWKWQKYIRKQKGDNKWKGSMERELINMNYKKWFPGWLPSTSTEDPLASNSDQCLTLSNRFEHPGGTSKDVGFYYFDSFSCSPNKNEKTFYICETTRQPRYGRAAKLGVQECYEGNGESYRGTKSATSNGTPCIEWTLSLSANPLTHPEKGLGDHKFCRNPDGDKQPWCWVKAGTNDFGFCDIPVCNQEPVSTTTVAPRDCPRNEFYCYNHVMNILYTTVCIPEPFRCDNEKDCDGREDEADCDYKLPLYKKKIFRTLKAPHKEKYIKIALEYCARLCVQSTTYVCRSISYNKDMRECLLFEQNSVTSTVIFSLSYDHYELQSQTDVQCDLGYKCKNGRCVGSDVLCNGVDDCLDFSDESGCVESVEESLKVRLADGEDQHSGRVEINYHGEWGVICDDNWDIKDAMVVCRMLGYDQALSAPGKSKFGSGNKNFLLDEVNCHGNEASLLSCEANSWKQHDCEIFEVAGVYCQQTKACNLNEFSCSNGNCIEQKLVCNTYDDCLDMSDENDCELKLELVNGSKSEGRIEVIRNGVRGTICDDNWDDSAATVVCRMLGYSNGIAKIGSKYGEGIGLIWLDDVVCSGAETSLDTCDFPEWGKHDCSHSEDAGVICTNTATVFLTATTEKSVLQLSVELSGNSSSDGRIVLYLNGTQGTVCDDDFDDKDATVVCRMLGFHSGQAIEMAASVYGKGTGEILVDDLDCNGSESSILECPYKAISDCTHEEDAGVKCYNTPNTGIEVRLVDGEVLHEGRVEVKVNGTVGGICRDAFSTDLAATICRSLGYSGLDIMLSKYSSNSKWLNGLYCIHGGESSLNECKHDEIRLWWGQLCDLGALGVRCIDTPTTMTTFTTLTNEVTTMLPVPDTVEIRLIGGPTDHEGNVLLVYDGQKGHICDDSWDNKDATVVCRMLGFGHGNATTNSHFGIGIEEIWMDDVNCTDEEVSILECQFNGWKVNDCARVTEIAGVICFEETTIVTVSLKNGSFEGEGRVEVTKGHITGTVCSDYWDVRDANVICAMLGYSSGIPVRNGAYGPGSGAILLDDVQCHGSEPNIGACLHEGWGNSNCVHSEDAGVICGNEIIEVKAKVELVDGPSKNEGRVEIVYSGVRGTVCGENFDRQKAIIVCRMLGFSSGWVRQASPGKGMIWPAEKWKCPESGNTLELCEQFPGVKSRCDHSQDAGVYCYNYTTHTATKTTTSRSTTTRITALSSTTRRTTTSPPTSGIQILLVNGNAPDRGRVEIIRNGVRGTVCDDGWDDNDATVICRMLGYNKGGIAVAEAIYGAGSGDIVLDDVKCDGTENSIEDCPHAGWGVSNCLHSEDAGVRCRQESQTSGTDDWYSTFSPECGNRPREAQIFRKKRQTPKLGGATAQDRPRAAKITQGESAEYGMYPWQVGVRKIIFQSSFSGFKLSSPWCGGTILNEHWILSAAHCFDGVQKSQITLRTGDHDSKNNDEYEQEFAVDAIYMHENYDSNSYDYDVALLKITSDDGGGIRFNDYVQPACLPNMDTLYKSETLCHISGWGKTEHGVGANVLRKAKVPLISDTKCGNLYKRGSITSRMFCAGYEEGGIDTCQGDSGGPLVCEIDGKYTVLGATSWGRGCGDAGYPGVYTHIRNLLPWITDKLKKYN